MFHSLINRQLNKLLEEFIMQKWCAHYWIRVSFFSFSKRFSITFYVIPRINFWNVLAMLVQFPHNKTQVNAIELIQFYMRIIILHNFASHFLNTFSTLLLQSICIFFLFIWLLSYCCHQFYNFTWFAEHTFNLYVIDVSETALLSWWILWNWSVGFPFLVMQLDASTVQSNPIYQWHRQKLLTEVHTATWSVTFDNDKCIRERSHVSVRDVHKSRGKTPLAAWFSWASTTINVALNRFCGSVIYLNAITAKTKFPLIPPDLF